eukprot:3505990-Amphidinium_carterae.1
MARSRGSLTVLFAFVVAAYLSVRRASRKKQSSRMTMDQRSESKEPSQNSDPPTDRPPIDERGTNGATDKR